MMCSILIFLTTMLVSSVKNGIKELSEKEYNDYHIILRDLNSEDFNKIKDKEYIEKIYIQEDSNKNLKRVDKNYDINTNQEKMK